MKTIHVINQIATCATIVLYLTIIGGMYAQLVLGPLQLLLAGIITYKYYKRLDKHTRRGLNQYWIAAIMALVAAGTSIFFSDSPNLFMLATLFIIPMAIAIYFLNLTADINANFKNLRHEL